MSKIKVSQNLLKINISHAEKIKNVLKKHNIKMINLIGSPGAGKTSLIEEALRSNLLKTSIGVIEGDIATTKDADRIKRFNVPVVQINTKSLCHLEAILVEKAIKQLPLEKLDLIIIENVGNLVCPVEFDLGEDFKVAVCSVAEGDDKPLKYPALFHKAKVIVLTKVDLIPHTNFDIKSFKEDIKRLNPKAKIIETSTATKEGIDKWVEFLNNIPTLKDEV